MQPSKPKRKPSQVLDTLAEVVWPDGNPDAQWSPDAIDKVAEVLRKAGREPKRPSKPHTMRGALAQLSDALNNDILTDAPERARSVQKAILALGVVDHWLVKIQFDLEKHGALKSMKCAANKRRAEAGARAVFAHRTTKGAGCTSLDTDITDTLANVLHFAAVMLGKDNALNAWETARDHYTTEARHGK